MTMREARQRAGMSYRRAAKAIGVNPASVYRWECKGARPRPWNLDKMARAYRVDVADLAL